MADYDPQATQRDVAPDVTAELVAAGFDDPVLIGRGGFGAVYRCLQPALDRTVAVKVMTDHLDDESLERFMREQRAMGRLSGHPNIVNILEVGATPEGCPFIVMPYHPHDSLDVRIRKHGPLDWRDVLRLGIKMSGALETAHRSGTLHRDVKPGNILLTEYGEPQLTDFGIARIVGGFETGADMVTGSPAFTAPELLSGSAPTVSSDIYGLGATLFCALTGHAAFERRSGEQVVAQFLRIASEPVPDLRGAGVPTVVSSAVEHAMAREPDARPGSAVDYGEELREIERQMGCGVDDMALPVASTKDPLTGGVPRGTSAPVITAPPIPATRFRPPLRPRAQVPREQILATLRAAERRRLILIHAPAGYGKTTVAVQWGEELADAGVTVAWLSIADDDNNLAWLLGHVVEAIRRSAPEVTGDLAEVLEQHGDKAEQYVLTTLIDAIHERGERVVLFVDDWHLVTDSAAIGAMEYLLDHGCHHLQIVITSRSRGGLPVSRMRVSDELVEIDVAGLCFDADEAKSFLLDVAGLELRGSEITELWHSTDGWAAALQLACLSLRESDKPAELISHISGRHHAIGDFLAENVLGALQPDLLDFLLTISLPERICAGLAETLSGEPRAQERLEDVETRDLFLRRTDPDGDWFRFHPLFVEFLRRRLERDHPDRVAGLHRAASTWFAAHEMLGDAVSHALAADDTDRAVALVEADGRSLVEHSQMTALLGLVDKLPPSAVASSPRIQLWLAWANVLLHRIDQAHAALRRVDAALSAAPVQGDDDIDIKAEADVAQACTQAIIDQYDGVDELVEACLWRPDALPPFVVSAAANVASLAATARFDFDAAHHWQEWAHPYHQRNSGSYSVMYGAAIDGLASFEQLDLDRAERCFRMAVGVSGRTGSGHTQPARLASALFAELLYERGDLAEATRLLEESFKIDAEEGITDMIKARFLISARLAQMRGDPEGAASHLDDAVDLAERLTAPRLRAHVEVEQATLGLPTRRPLQRRVEFIQRLRTPSGNAARIAQLHEEVSIRLLLKESGGDDADRELVGDTACRWAQEWSDRLADNRRPRARLRADRLLATCLATVGRTGDAKRHAVSVLTRCAAAGMVRYPVDGGAMFRSVVSGVRDDLGSDPSAPEFAGLSIDYLNTVLRVPD
ncbi:protein kinase [Gordonia sp. CPCC 206044]|uniref:protein kinase domain-containing protein n=1 Tax=Gordonia sp. CPCC 206044 TaxID=3140793 RepID=UPI003AF3C8F4